MFRRFFSLSCVATGLLRAQAAVEYSLKAGGSAVSETANQAHLGVCRINADFLSCASRAYPKTTLIVAMLAGLMVLRWFMGSGHRAR